MTVVAVLVICSPAVALAHAHVRPRHRGVAVRVVQTTADLSQRITRLPDRWLMPGAPRIPTVVRINDAIRYQTVVGFGATLSDTAAWLIHDALYRSARTQLMRRLFSRGGIHLSYLRVPIGASDFTATQRPYSYDDLPAGWSDPDLQHFSVAHDVPYIIPTLRQALAINPGIFVFANPWSAPSWMKTNQLPDNFGGSGTLIPGDFGPYADYFVKFLRAYESHGIRVDAVAPQNEPGVAADPAMNLSEADEESFIAGHLAPALRAAGLSTKVYGLDMSWDMFNYADGLATGSASASLSGISWHCYYGNPAVMTQLHAAAPTMIQLVNECSPEIRPFSTTQLVIGSLRNWASSVALWNLALDRAGGPVQPPGTWCPHCRGLVTIDETTHRARRGFMYYQLGQVSRFVPPGAVRVASNTFVSDGTDRFYFYQPSAGIDDVAFVNPDGQHVLVTYNSLPHPARFAVSWRGHALLYRQPAGATTTFTWR